MMAVLNRALLDFLWQGAAAALIAACVLHSTKKPGPRYLALCLILAILSLAPFCALVHAGRPGLQASAGIVPSESFTVIAWMTGSGLGLLHLAVSCLLLKRRPTALRDAKIEAIVSGWAERLNICRPIRVVLDSRLEVPAIAGLTHLALYLPLAAVTRLSPQQLESLIVHELVHAKRFDAVVNHCQTVIERLFFFHPAVWWISHQIRIEREHLCDEEVLRLLPDRYTYASALALVEELRNAPLCKLTVAASGGELSERIARVLQVQKRFRTVRHPIKLAMAACAMPIVLSLLLSQSGAKPVELSPLQDMLVYSSENSPFQKFAHHADVSTPKAALIEPTVRSATKPRSRPNTSYSKGHNTEGTPAPQLALQYSPIAPIAGDQATDNAVPQPPSGGSHTPDERYRQTLKNVRETIENAKKSVENAERSLDRSAYGKKSEKKGDPG